MLDKSIGLNEELQLGIDRFDDAVNIINKNDAPIFHDQTHFVAENTEVGGAVSAHYELSAYDDRIVDGVDRESHPPSGE